MKHITKILLSSLLITSLWSCTKDEHKIYYEGGTNPVLTSSVAGTTLPLSFANKDQQALVLNWTNPNYQFTTGISSQDVNYNIEIDTAVDFSNPNKQTVAISKELTKSFTQGEFNDFLLNQLVLVPGISHNIGIRVKSSINTNAVTLYSNTIKYAVTPYAIPPKVTPPSTGQLFLVGSATAGAWNNPVPVPSQQFTKVSTTLFTITIPLTGGQEFVFLPLNGDWGHKYNHNNSTVVATATGGDFGPDLGSLNLPGPAASGTYKIDVDFQRGKFTVVKQ